MLLLEVEKQIYEAPEYYFWTHKDGNINGNLVTVILVLINYRSKNLTNFEANAKQNEVKINNRFSEELPADADETNVKTRVFLCYASNSIKSQSSTFFGGCSTPWYFHRRHKIQ
jgi:hypothetical protein